MSYHNRNVSKNVSDEERRDFLKALGVSGAVAAGGVTLEEVRHSMSADAAEELAPIGQAIAEDLAGELDAELIASQQSAVAEATAGLTATLERGFPETAPRDEFAAVAGAGRPVYDHFGEVGFFESTTAHLPEFTPGYLESTVETFVGSETLAGPLDEIGFGGVEGSDLLATVIGNAERLSDYHWVATDEIPREQVEYGKWIPPMTQVTVGGTLLWLEDLDNHLWQKRRLLTEAILEKAVWRAQSMAAGFYLMSEGARSIGAEDASYDDTGLGALLSIGFAVQAISQGLLPEEVYWITEEMSAERTASLETITADSESFIGGD